MTSAVSSFFTFLLDWFVSFSKSDMRWYVQNGFFAILLLYVLSYVGNQYAKDREDYSDFVKAINTSNLNTSKAVEKCAESISAVARGQERQTEIMIELKESLQKR